MHFPWAKIPSWAPVEISHYLSSVQFYHILKTMTVSKMHILINYHPFIKLCTKLYNVRNFRPVSNWWLEAISQHIRKISEHAQKPLNVYIHNQNIPPICDRWFLTNQKNIGVPCTSYCLIMVVS